MPQNSSSTLILIALMALGFYFLILRPQKKRQQAQRKTMNELVPGTRVVLASGVFGTLVSIGEKQATIEISPGAEMTVLKQAISRVVADSEEDGFVADGEEDGFVADGEEDGFVAENDDIGTVDPPHDDEFGGSDPTAPPSDPK